MRQLPSKAWRWEVMHEGRRYGGTQPSKTLAQQALARHIADATRGGIVDPSSVTVSEYLTTWLEGKAKTRSVRSGELQAGILRRYVAPVIGTIRLQKLTPADLRRLFDGLTNKGLGKSTQRQTHQFLHHALEDAVRVEMLTRNVADVVRPTPPKEVESEELDAFTPEEAAAFIQACREDEWGRIFEFAVSTGMRRGEFSGLRWIDVDLNKSTAQVRETVSDDSEGSVIRASTPKTKNSRRTVYLSRSAVRVLREQQAHQAQQRLILGEEWQESGRVFTNTTGGTMRPSNLRRHMERITKAAGVRHLRIHGLRDTYASLAARQGVPIEVISKQLGHASVAFTLSVYRTVFKDERQRWALDVDVLTSDPEEEK